MDNFYFKPIAIAFGIGLLLLIYSVVYQRGYNAAVEKYNKQYQAELIKQQNKYEKQLKAATLQNEELSRQKNQIIEKKIFIKEEINEAKNTNIDVVVPLHWIMLINASATSGNEMPDTRGTARIDDTARTIKASKLTAIVVDNYSQCNVYIEQLKGWQSWYKQISGVEK